MRFESIPAMGRPRREKRTAVNARAEKPFYFLTCLRMMNLGFGFCGNKRSHVNIFAADTILFLFVEAAMLHEYKGKWPILGERVYIAEGVQIIGDVVIGDHSSVWFNSVIRGDVNYVRIGKH